MQEEDINHLFDDQVDFIFSHGDDVTFYHAMMLGYKGKEKKKLIEEYIEDHLFTYDFFHDQKVYIDKLPQEKKDNLEDWLSYAQINQIVTLIVHGRDFTPLETILDPGFGDKKLRSSYQAIKRAKDQIEFANNNINDPNLSLRKVDRSYKVIKRELKKIRSGLFTRYESIISIINNAPSLDEDYTVFRGIRLEDKLGFFYHSRLQKDKREYQLDPFSINIPDEMKEKRKVNDEWESLKKGDHITFKSIFSTSFDPFVSDAFTNRFCCLLKINLRKGDRGLLISTYQGKNNFDEVELLVPSSTYVVDEIGMIRKKNKNIISGKIMITLSSL
jgi:hypothetical protein